MTDLTVEKLWEAACAVRKRAHAPYSTYRVGAALMVQGSDQIFTGCNVENASYGATLCAERSAVLQAVAAMDETPKIESILIVTADPASPCGMCLQVLSEFSTPDTPVHLATPEQLSDSFTLKDFLPHPFTPKDLNDHA